MLVRRFIREGLACEWQTCGRCSSSIPAGMEQIRRPTNFLGVQHAARLFFGERYARSSRLETRLGGGWLYEGDAHLRPDRLMSSWRAKLESRDAAIREGCTVEGFARQGGIATAVRTSQGEISADAFVLAAGALTPFLNDHLGCRIPIQPGKGYSITSSRPAKCPQVPMIFEEHRVAVTPMQSGYRLGSMMEFVGYNESIRPKRVGYLQKAASIYLDEPLGAMVEERWFGWRPMTPDSRPIIGRSPAIANVMIAAGHNMLAFR